MATLSALDAGAGVGALEPEEARVLAEVQSAAESPQGAAAAGDSAAAVESSLVKLGGSRSSDHLVTVSGALLGASAETAASPARKRPMPELSSKFASERVPAKAPVEEELETQASAPETPSPDADALPPFRALNHPDSPLLEPPMTPADSTRPAAPCPELSLPEAVSPPVLASASVRLAAEPGGADAATEVEEGAEEQSKAAEMDGEQPSTGFAARAAEQDAREEGELPEEEEQPSQQQITMAKQIAQQQLEQRRDSRSGSPDHERGPLSVELLLLDEDLLPETCGDEGRRGSSGKSLLSDLQRQLGDGASHLRRKSAFGSLVSRGASVRLLGYEQVEEQRVKASDAETHQDTERSPAWVRPGVVPSRAGKAHQESLATAVKVVPRIVDFPRPARGPMDMPDDGLGLISALFSWLPSCGPTSVCKASPSETVEKGCSSILLPEQAPAQSAPEAASAASGASVEAGLGGWPLSVPQAYVAFLSSPSSQPAGPTSPTGTSGGSSASSRRPLLASVGTPEFHKAAMELDESELVLVPALCQNAQARGSCGTSRSSGSCGATPSTASTSKKAEFQSSDQPEQMLQRWPTQSRLVCRREGLSTIKKLRPPDLAKLISPDFSPPYPHVVEFEGSAFGVVEPLHVLLALPTAALVSRFSEAVHQALPPSSHGSSKVSRRPRLRGGVRCEMRIHARVRLDTPEDVQNCIAVVRRGICEACHVCADRVRVGKVWMERSSSTWMPEE
eukprot:TRINITY_DN20265_c0_g1_i2.p1 TRINITY_DN20265_c0_g1~~TRINITY_DN20265_c0_g1_i2.p1  ORF type:complete len:737 (-),score=146.07 TRINITY_DN20265_c0_g1_i2:70-2280(-)